MRQCMRDLRKCDVGCALSVRQHISAEAGCRQPHAWAPGGAQSLPDMHCRCCLACHVPRARSQNWTWAAAQVTIRGIILDANPFITAYATPTNKYHTGYYIQNVRAPACAASQPRALAWLDAVRLGFGSHPRIPCFSGSLPALA